MRKLEAHRLRFYLDQVPSEELTPLIELGSSDSRFRTVIKPHIHELVHQPLIDRGIRIVCSDIRDGDGIDVAGDIYDAHVREQLERVGAKSLLCCNILEHLEDRATFAATCSALVGPGGYVIATVPFSFPYHLDPIDTYYRPTPDEIASLFPDFEIVNQEIVRDGDYWSDLNSQKSVVSAITTLMMELVRAITLRGGVERSKSRIHRFCWLFRTYKISLVVLRKKRQTL